MKVSRHARSTEKEILSVKNKPEFKIAPVLSQRALSLLASSSTTKRPSTSSPTSGRPNIEAIANTMKLRMKAAVNTMVWNNTSNPELLSSLVSKNTYTAKSSFSQQQQQQQHQHQQHSPKSTTINLTNHTLLQQYLTFVQEETGVMVALDTSSTSATDSLPMPSLNHQPHPSASTGTSLIESLVSKMTELYKQKDANQIGQPSRSPSFGGATSKMDIDQLKVDLIQYLNKSDRLRSRENQSQQHGHCSRTDSPMLTNNGKQSEISATSVTSASTEIRCICNTPHEEFGSMVQCDDCSYWLHMDCLALDEDGLDDTYRCPSCLATLGPTKNATNCTFTWRLPAQKKSKELGSNHRKSKEHGNISKRHLHPIAHTQTTGRQRLVQLQPLYPAYDDKCDADDSFSVDNNDSNGDLENDEQQHTVWIPTVPTYSGNDAVQATNIQSTIINDSMDDENSFDSDATESDSEFGDTYQPYIQQQHQYHVGADHRSSVSSSASSVVTVPSLVSSPSHTSNDLDNTGTFDEHHGNNNFYPLGTTKYDASILSTTTSSKCLDQVSLLWLSRLAYLESLQSSSNQKWFVPHASDVFLCSNQLESQHQINPLVMESTHIDHDAQLPTMATRSDLPSTICSHDLPQFHFDPAIFWNPTDSSPFF